MLRTPMASSIVAAEDVLAIQKVVIFNNGMISLDRQGEVPPNSKVRLKIPTANLDDALGSLSWDGPVEIVSRLKMAEAFRSAATLALEQEEAEIDYESIIRAHIGVEAELTVDFEAVSEHTVLRGILAGVNSESKEVCVVNSDGITKIKLEAVRTVRFVQERIQQELMQTLSRKLASSVHDLSEVEVATASGGKISLRYNLAGVPWSTGYHMNLSDGAILIKCFACVDNATPENWNAVQMILVTGMMAKTEAILNDHGNEITSAMGDGIHVFVKQASGKTHDVRVNPRCHVHALRKHIARLESLSVDKIKLVFAGKVLEDHMRLEQYHVQKECCINVITTGKMTNFHSTTGSWAKMDMVDQESLSWYPCEKSISILKGHSVMLPYNEVKLEGAEVAIFDDGKNKERLLRGVRLHNSSDKTLEAGSVLVERAGSFLGETEMATLRPKDDCFLTFAILVNTSVTKSTEPETHEFTRSVIASGQLELIGTTHLTTVYTVTNKTSADYTLFLLHTLKRGWELSSTTNSEVVDVVCQSDAQTQQRLRCVVKKGGVLKLTVVEKKAALKTRHLSNDLMAEMDLHKVTQVLGLSQTVQKGLERAQKLAQNLTEKEAELKKMKLNMDANSKKAKEVKQVIQNIQGAHRAKYENELHSTYQKECQFNEEKERAVAGKEELEKRFETCVRRVFHSGPIDARFKKSVEADIAAKSSWRPPSSAASWYTLAVDEGDEISDS